MSKSAATRSTILVFDSGIGGLSIVDSLFAACLDCDIYYVADTAYFPYGDKSDQTLIERVPDVVEKAALECQADLVIIACNTASTLALDHVRERVKVPVVGVVPAIKPAAALTKSGVIGLLATPNTVVRPYTDKLIADFAYGKKVVRHGAIGLAAAVETYISCGELDTDVVRASMEGLFAAPDGKRIDVIVLACTHYPLIIAALASYAPHFVFWVNSGPAIAERAANLLDLSEDSTPTLHTAFTTGGADHASKRSLQHWGFETFKTI